MNDEHDKYLCETFPKLFLERGTPRSPMYWGFECGDGWFNLIKKLCEDIQKYVDEQGIPQVVVAQVKEKFGGLRFYVDFADDHIYTLIDNAEILSTHTCDVCGEPGERRSGGWIRTLCDKHHAERQAKE
jgi:hypothetical protein